MRQLQGSLIYFAVTEFFFKKKVSLNGNYSFKVTVKPWSSLRPLLVPCSYQGQAAINMVLTSGIPEDGLSQFFLLWKPSFITQTKVNILFGEAGIQLVFSHTFYTY